MQDCHSCDPGSIPGVGALLFTMMSCYCATNSAPNLDPINSWSCSCDVDAGSALALDNVAHESPTHLLFINSAMGLAHNHTFIAEHRLARREAFHRFSDVGLNGIPC